MTLSTPLIALLCASAAVIASTAAAADPAASSPVSCVRPQIGLLAPLTGDAASIGEAQLTWAQHAARNFNRAQARAHRSLRVLLAPKDTALDPVRATAAAQEFVKNARMAAVVGPAISQEAQAISPILATAGLALVSGSATDTSLTIGGTRLRGFFRTVPHEATQAPSIGRYVKNVLKARRVVIVDDRQPVSVALARSIQRNLERGAVKAAVDRQSIAEEETDWSPVLARVRPQTQAVVLVLQQPARAQAFAQQLRDRGRRTPIVGPDSLYAPGFTIEGAYVASFAPDIRTVTWGRSYWSAYSRRFEKPFSLFGPPTYLATQVVINAVANACRDRKATRGEVQTWIRRTFIPASILGRPFSFDARGDPRGARFSILQIRKGRYVTVG